MIIVSHTISATRNYFRKLNLQNPNRPLLPHQDIIIPTVINIQTILN